MINQSKKTTKPPHEPSKATRDTGESYKEVNYERAEKA